MRLFSLSFMALMLAASATAQTIDMADFDTKIGTVLEYQGNFEEGPGTMTLAVHSGNDTVAGSIRQDMVIKNNWGSTQVQTSTFSVNSEIARINVTDTEDSYVINYTQRWGANPRYMNIGQNYNDSGAYNYLVEGMKIQGTAQSTAKILGIETVETGMGRFEAIKVTATVTTNETFRNVWVKLVDNETVWLARGIGVVKYESSGIYTTSTGDHETIVMDYSIQSSNLAHPSLPVYPETRPAYDGWAYGMGEWSYSFSTRTWYVIDGNALATDLNANTTRLYPEASNGFIYNMLPFYYSIATESWHFISSSGWIYDAYTDRVYGF